MKKATPQDARLGEVDNSTAVEEKRPALLRSECEALQARIAYAKQRIAQALGQLVEAERKLREVDN